MSFDPASWLSGPHAQTLSVAFPRGVPSRAFLRGARPFVHPVHGGGWPRDPGDGAVSGQMHWQDRRAPLAVLVHGLGGSCESLYVQQVAQALHRRGAHVLRLDQRGAGASARFAPYLYHAGITSDLDTVVRAFGEAPLVDGVVLVGFSIGGNVVLRLAGEWADAPPRAVSAVVSLAAPVDLAAAADNLARWQALLYRRHVLQGLVAQALRFKHHRPQRARYRRRAVLQATQIRQYDAEVIVPAYGFEHVDDYYARASAGPRLGSIGVRTLLLHATDDPMVPGAGVERLLAGASAQVDVRVTARGGHLGWAESLEGPSLAERWSTRELLRFVGLEG